MRGMRIAGTGSYLPGAPVSNQALSRVKDTSDDWIVQRTGISARHFAAPGVGASDLAKIASKRALENAKLSAGDID